MHIFGVGQKEGYPFSGGNNIGNIKFKRKGNEAVATSIIPKDSISKLRIDFDFFDPNNSQISISKLVISDFYNCYILSPGEIIQTFKGINGAFLYRENEDVKIELDNEYEDIPHIFTNNLQFYLKNKNFTIIAFIKLFFTLILLIPGIYFWLLFVKTTKYKNYKAQIILQLSYIMLLSIFIHYCMIILMQFDFQQSFIWIKQNYSAFWTGSFIIYMLCLIIWGITKSVFLTSLITEIFLYIVSIINHYKNTIPR